VRRRKVVYPPAKTATRSDPSAALDPRAAAAASRIVSINLNAMTGRAGIEQGGRVQISSGLYAGEFATVESVVGGVIPAAVVRTEAGHTRRVRTVDLVSAPTQKATAPAAAPASNASASNGSASNASAPNASAQADGPGPSPSHSAAPTENAGR
jgi:hypothetical protein